MWNRSRESRQPRHEQRFSDLVRDQLYSSNTTPNHEEMVQFYLVAEQDLDVNYPAAPPASAAAIESLIETTVMPGMSEEDCAVCRETMVFDDRMKQLPCQHQFHKDCIVPWLQRRNTCPICRYELPTDDEHYDMQRRAVRRIEFSPERSRSPPVIVQEQGSDIEDEESDDLDHQSSSSSSAADADGTNQFFNLQGLVADDTDYDLHSMEGGDEFDRLEWLSDWGFSDLYREWTQEVEEEGDDADHDRFSMGCAASPSQFIDVVNLSLQERLNLYVAPLRAEISRLQHRLTTTMTALDQERARNQQLERQLHHLQGRCTRAESQGLTTQYLENIEGQVRHGLRQTRRLLQGRAGPHHCSVLRCGSCQADLVHHHCTSCSQPCPYSAPARLRCPSCYE